MPAAFDSHRCKGCGLCVSACPKKIVQLDPNLRNKKGYSLARCLDTEKCNSCGFCAIICPDLAVTVSK